MHVKDMSQNFNLVLKLLHAAIFKKRQQKNVYDVVNTHIVVSKIDARKST